MKKTSSVFFVVVVIAVFVFGGKDTIHCLQNQDENLQCLIDSIVSPANKNNAGKDYASEPSGELMRLDYEGFAVWLNCERKGAVKFRYNAQRDRGNQERSESFYIDKDVPRECQQTSTSSYGEHYDRGHLVPANHMDYSATAIKQSNYMTNILPQAANMNRGAWLQTEEIVECYRDIDELLVIGGVIWGNDSSDDYFVSSHGVQTPDAFWKVIIRGRSGNERVDAWIIPNSQDAKRDMLDSYLVSPAAIEKITGEKLPVPDYLRNEVPAKSWVLPTGCNKS